MPGALLYSVFVDHTYICVYGYAQSLFFMCTTCISCVCSISQEHQYTTTYFQFSFRCSFMKSVPLLLQTMESWVGPGNKARAPLVLTHLTNGIVQWVSCGLIPEDGGFTLAWDPNPFQSLQIPLLLQLIHHIIQTINHTLQYLMWIQLMVAVGAGVIAVNQVITEQWPTDQ